MVLGMVNEINKVPALSEMAVPLEGMTRTVYYMVNVSGPTCTHWWHLVLR